MIDTHRSILKSSTERSKNTNTNKSKTLSENIPSADSYDLPSKHKEGSSENVMKNRRPKCKKVGFVGVNESTLSLNKTKGGDRSNKTSEPDISTKKAKKNHFISRYDEIATNDDVLENQKQRLSPKGRKEPKECKKKQSTDVPVLLNRTPRLVTDQKSTRPLPQVEEQIRPQQKEQQTQPLHNETCNAGE